MITKSRIQSFLLLLVFLIQCISVSAQNSDNLEQQAISLLNSGDKSKASEFFGKAAINYWNKGSLQKAVDCFKKVIEINTALNNTNAILVVQNNLGLLYSDMEDYNNALESFKKAYELSKKGKPKIDVVSALQNIAITLQYLNKYKESIPYLLDAQSICEELGDLKLIRKTYSSLAESYEKSAQSDKAFEYYEKFSILDKKIKQSEMDDVKQKASTDVNIANQQKNATEKELNLTSDILKQTSDSLELSERLAKEQQMQIELRNSQIREKETQIKYDQSVKRILVFVVIGVFAFLIVLGFFFRQKQRDNKLLTEKNIEIEKQKTEITGQNAKLDRQNQNIKASISYAQTIQQAILPIKSIMDQHLDSYIIYRPKDIVSGDFYWFATVKDQNNDLKKFLVVCDCTGHGVPGAFMSLIGSRLLSEIIIEKRVHKPSQILTELNNELRIALKQTNSENNDGMDVCLCLIDNLPADERKVTFAGAKRPLLFYHSASKIIDLVEGDNSSIGGRSAKKENIEFSDQELMLNKGDYIFLTSDGIIDQNGPDRKRFGSPRLMETIVKSINEPLEIQKENLEKTFDAYVNNEEQRDDITLIGVKLI